MDARVAKIKVPNISFVVSPVKLTISLLVSNRIDTIRKCLDSLQPLLKAIPSELIVVDTVGEENSDGSLAVAREYTDKIVHFKWCDDFAAARNAGLKLAHGEWFMYLDDDEWFEDITELTEFFISGECNKYNRVNYQVRNFMNAEGTKYSITPAQRIARMTTVTKFESPVHEYLNPLCDPTKILSCFVHHYGYLFKNIEEKVSHFKRNVSLLMTKDQNLVHTQLQLAQEYEGINKYDEMESCCRKGLELNPKNDLKQWLLAGLCRSFYYQEKNDEIIAEAKRIAEIENPTEITLLNIYMLLPSAYYKKGDYDNAIYYSNEYFKMYQYLAEKPDLVEEQHVLSNTDCMLDSVRLSSINSRISYSQEYEKYDDLIDFIKTIPLQEEFLKEEKKNYLAVLVDACCKTSRFEEVTEAFEQQMGEDDSLTLECIFALKCSWKNLDEYKTYELKEAVAKVDCNDPYVWTQRALVAERYYEDDLDEILKQMAQNEFTCNYPCHELFLLLLRKEYNLAPFVSKMDKEDWEDCVQHLNNESFGKLKELLPVADRLLSSISMQKYYLLYIVVQRAALDNEDLEEKEFIKIVDCYAENVLNYSHLIYRKELFQNENLRELPREIRFNIYLQKALDSYKNNKPADYLRFLRLGIKEYPLAKSLADRMMKFITEKEENEKKEFKELGQQVKAKIVELIQAGLSVEASSLLSQLKTILPNDEEIKNLEGML